VLLLPVQFAGGCRQRTLETIPAGCVLSLSVGSCTDLKASVSYPLRRIYGDDFSIAPLAVLIDPVRALRIWDGAGKTFSPKVLYIYKNSSKRPSRSSSTRSIC